MNHQFSRPMNRSSTGVRAATLVVVTLALTNLTGCSSVKSLLGLGGGNRPLRDGDDVVTPVSPVDEVATNDPAAKPATPAAAKGPKVPSAADLMFTDTAAPFENPGPREVNVFGELDGVGPGVYQPGGAGGFNQVTYVDEGFDADPRISPDGKTLLFSSTRHSEHPDIYTQKVDGLAITQITSDPGDDAFPAFSPDGGRVAFASNRSGNWDIYVMDIDGSDVRAVTRTPAQDVHPSFSPDGSRIVYSSLGSRSGQWELWTVDLKTLERKMIGYGLFPEWCPRADKDLIAFQRARQRGTRWFSAWTLELIDGEAKNVTEVAFSTNAAIVAPTWNPEGTKLAFSSVVDPTAANPGAMSSPNRGTQQDIWVVNADGTNRYRLTDGRGVNATPSWSPDGKVFFVSDRGGSESVWSVPVSKSRMQTAGAKE
jgi:TolB protein